MKVIIFLYVLTTHHNFTVKLDSLSLLCSIKYFTDSLYRILNQDTNKNVCVYVYMRVYISVYIDYISPKGDLILTGIVTYILAIHQNSSLFLWHFCINDGLRIDPIVNLIHQTFYCSCIFCFCIFTSLKTKERSVSIIITLN